MNVNDSPIAMGHPMSGQGHQDAKPAREINPNYEDWFHDALSKGLVSAASDKDMQLAWEARGGKLLNKQQVVALCNIVWNWAGMNDPFEKIKLCKVIQNLVGQPGDVPWLT